MKSKGVDLTAGSIWEHVLAFAAPILIEQLLQNFYNSVDAIVVGRLVGMTALAAVTSCGDIAQLMISFFAGLSAGAGVMFSHARRTREYAALHDTIHTAVAFSILLGSLMAAAGAVFTPFLLRVVNCPNDVLGEATVYLRIYLIGVLFTAVYNVGAGVLRAIGDTKSPLLYLTVSSAANVGLDLLFVAWAGMGVLGAGLATVLSQFFAAALVFRRMMRSRSVYHLSLRELRLRPDLLRQAAKLGLPAAVQNALVCISSLFVQRYTNGFGSQVMAGVGAARKVDRFLLMICQSIGLSAGAFVGQNIAAGQYRRTFEGIRTCAALNVLFLFTIGVPAYFFAPQVIGIFSKDTAAAAYGVQMLRVLLPLYFLQVLNHIFSNAVRGFGHPRAAMLLSAAGMIGVRQVFLAAAMHRSPVIENIYFGYPVGWGSAALFMAAYYFLAVRPEYRRLAAEEENT